MGAQSKDMAQRLDEAEANALKGGKKATNKMETRVRELESELDAESRRQADALKNFKERSRPTRSKLKKPKRLLLLTSPNSERLQGKLIQQLVEPTLQSRQLPRAALADAVPPLDQSKLF